MKKIVAFLGPPGTYTDQASHNYAPNHIRVPYPSIKAVTEAMEKGKADECVVPIENSLGGTILEVADHLIQAKKTLIKAEILLRIDHCLIGEEISNLSQIKVVKSKFEAFQQCKDFIDRYLTEAKLVSTSSTATAVNELKNDGKWTVAIGPKRSAELAGIPVIKEHIQDKINNITRFVVLSKRDHEPTGKDKTSIIFEFGSDAPGLIYTALKPFAENNINLTKIESRPTGKSLGSYIFLLDFEGHKTDAKISETIKKLKPHMSKLKILGSYPITHLPKDTQKN